MQHANIHATRGKGILENFLANKRAQIANSLIPKNLSSGKILDIGCGSYPIFLKTTHFKEKYGVDPVAIQEEVDGISIKRADVTKNKLPFKENYFDVVTMLAVFEHIDGDKLNFVLSEAFRVLKKDGVFIITTPAPWADKLLHAMARTSLISKEEIHEHKHNHTKERIEKYISKSGFNESKIKSGYFELGFNMWFMSIK